MKNLFKNIVNNPYFEVVSIFLTSLVIDTATGNRIITYILLAIAGLALFRAILKDVFGIETPYIKYLLKFLKFNRLLEKMDNQEKLYQDMEKNYHQVKDLIEKNKGGFINFMKKLLKGIYANKITISGFLAGLLIIIEMIFDISTKLNIGEEWYYTAIAVLFILVEWAVFGRGPETINKFFALKSEKDKIKANKEIQKRIEEAKKFKELLDFANQTPPQPPTSQTQVRQLTKEELEAKYGR